MYQPIKFFAHNSESIKTTKSLLSILENLKNIVSFTRFFKNRYVQITTIRKRMELA